MYLFSLLHYTYITHGASLDEQIIKNMIHIYIIELIISLFSYHP